VGSSLQNLFDNVSGAENEAGDTEYRCFSVKNTHSTLTLLGAKIWIDSNTPSSTSTVEIGLGSAAISATEQTVANESTAPTSVTFSAPATFAGGLTIGDLAPNATKAIWVKRIITAGGVAYNSDAFSVTVQGETGA
jgi:hypothetical protein